MAKKKRRKLTPYIGGGILTDNSSIDKSGKMNAYGIFTMFWAWDFPCNRLAEAIITMFNMPKRKTKVIISVKKKGNRAKTIASITVKAEKANPPLWLVILLYHLHFPQKVTMNSYSQFHKLAERLRLRSK